MLPRFGSPETSDAMIRASAARILSDIRIAAIVSQPTDIPHEIQVALMTATKALGQLA